MELVAVSGDDLLAVNAARASFGKESKWDVVELEGEDENGKFTEYVQELSERDRKLIWYLAKNSHVLPFRHPQITLRIKAPIFVCRQLG